MLPHRLRGVLCVAEWVQSFVGSGPRGAVQRPMGSAGSEQGVLPGSRVCQPRLQRSALRSSPGAQGLCSQAWCCLGKAGRTQPQCTVRLRGSWFGQSCGCRSDRAQLGLAGDTETTMRASGSWGPGSRREAGAQAKGGQAHSQQDVERGRERWVTTSQARGSPQGTGLARSLSATHQGCGDTEAPPVAAGPCRRGCGYSLGLC